MFPCSHNVAETEANKVCINAFHMVSKFKGVQISIIYIYNDTFHSTDVTSNSASCRSKLFNILT